MQSRRKRKERRKTSKNVIILENNIHDSGITSTLTEELKIKRW